MSSVVNCHGPGLTELGARLLRVLACSSSLGSCSSCGGSSGGKVAHRVALLAERRGVVRVLQEEFAL